MPLSGVGEVAVLTMTRSISRGVISTRASSESETGLPSWSFPLAVTTFVCTWPPTPVTWRVSVFETFSPGTRLIGTSKTPLPSVSSRSPKTLSTTFEIVTLTFDVLLIVTVKSTGPPGSFTEVGSADFWTSIAPWPTGTSLFVTVHVAEPPGGITRFEQLSYVVVYPAATGSVTLYVPAPTVRSFWPSASNDCAAPPSTWKEKSCACFVPPLSLTTTFFTMSVAGSSSFVIVQLTSSPSPTATVSPSTWLSPVQSQSLAS